MQFRLSPIEFVAKVTIVIGTSYPEFRRPFDTIHNAASRPGIVELRQ